MILKLKLPGCCIYNHRRVSCHFNIISLQILNSHTFNVGTSQLNFQSNLTANIFYIYNIFKKRLCIIQYIIDVLGSIIYDAASASLDRLGGLQLQFSCRMYAAQQCIETHNALVSPRTSAANHQRCRNCMSMLCVGLGADIHTRRSSIGSQC